MRIPRVMDGLWRGAAVIYRDRESAVNRWRMCAGEVSGADHLATAERSRYDSPPPEAPGETRDGPVGIRVVPASAS
jgi:hypothetical protein